MAKTGWMEIPVEVFTAIKLLKEKGYKIEGPEPEKIELNGGEYLITTDCRVVTFAAEDDILNGAAFATQEIAEAVAKQRLKRNRLEAYAVEYMGSVYEFKHGEDNYYIYYGHDREQWVGSYHRAAEFISTIYMTKDCALYLCEALNSGRIVL